MAETQANQGFRQQLSSLLGRLTTGQKLLIGGVALLTIGGIVLLVSTVGSQPMSILFTELQEKDAALIVDRLNERQIAHDLIDKGRTIMVPSDQLHNIRLSLASEGLPETSVVGYEIFDRTNLGMSDFVQRLNYRRALEGELARTVMTLDEVQKARVHIVIPERALFERDQKDPTASVVLQMTSGRRISKINVEGIQNLVAASVEGMDPAAVKVMDQKARVLSEPVKDENSLAGMSSTQYEQKQKVDHYLSQKVQTLLDEVLGIEKSVVRVDAELDFTRSERTVEDFNPDRQVVRSEQIITEESTSQDSLNYPVVNAEAQRGNSITNYEIAKSVEKIISGVGSVSRMTVAVLVDGSYNIVENDGVATREYAPRSEAELDQLRQIIRNAVGYDPARNDQISVVNIPFEPGLDEELPVTGVFTGIPFLEDLQDVGAGMVVLLAAMLLAVILIWRLIASPQVRRRIEQVLAPSDLERQRVELAKAAAERQQKLLQSLSESSDFLALPGVTSDEEIAAGARTRLEALESPESAEETAYKKEVRGRVFEYLKTKPDDASRIIKTMLRQDSLADLMRNM